MPSFDVQPLTDFEKMRYSCANMQTFAAHYSTRGNWPKLFTALIRALFFGLIHISLTFSERDVGAALSYRDKNHFGASTSSETQGQLVGSIKCSWWKFSVRSRRARLDLTENFHHEHFIDPTNCPWVSEDVRDVTMAKIVQTNKLPSSPPPDERCLLYLPFVMPSWPKGSRP